MKAKYSQDDLLSHLRALAKQLGRTPTHRDIAMAGKMNNADYINHFGSLRRAQKAAGLVPCNQTNICIG